MPQIAFRAAIRMDKQRTARGTLFPNSRQSALIQAFSLATKSKEVPDTIDW